MDEDSDHDTNSNYTSLVNRRNDVDMRDLRENNMAIEDCETSSTRYLYDFPIQIVVKNYKGQQQRTSNSLSVVQLKCQDVDDFKSQLWNMYHDYIKGKAIIPSDETLPCSLSSDPPDISEAHCYFQFEHGKKSISFPSEGVSKGRISLSTLQTWSRKTDVLEGTLYTYSVSIQTQKIWERFNSDVLQPRRFDRAGAPAQEHIDQIARTIKQRFRGTPRCLCYFKNNAIDKNMCM
jgi:hypothetical protein